MAVILDLTPEVYLDLTGPTIPDDFSTPAELLAGPARITWIAGWDSVTGPGATFEPQYTPIYVLEEQAGPISEGLEFETQNGITRITVVEIVAGIRLAQELTFSVGQALTFTTDPVARSLKIEGATTGNGTFTSGGGTWWPDADTTMRVGGYTNASDYVTDLGGTLSDITFGTAPPAVFDLPSAMLTGPWSVDWTSSFASSAGPGAQFAAFFELFSDEDGFTEGVEMMHVGGVTSIIVTELAGTRLERVVTFSAAQTLTLTLDRVAKSLTIAGATTGNGTFTASTGGSFWPNAGSTVRVGSFSQSSPFVTDLGGTFGDVTDVASAEDGAASLAGSGALAVVGRSIVNATCALAGLGTLANTGRSIKNASVALAGAAGETVLGRARVDGVVAFDGTAVLAVNNTAIATASVALAGGADLGVSDATAIANAVVALAGGGDVAPTQSEVTASSTVAAEGAAELATTGGSGVIEAAAALEGVADLTGGITAIIDASVALAGGAGTDSTGTYRATSALAGSGDLAAAGQSIATSAASAAGTAALLCVGAAATLGAVSMTCAGDLAVVGSARARGTVGLAGGAGMTATGAKIANASVALFGACTLLSAHSACSMGATANLAAVGRSIASASCAHAGSAAMTVAGSARAGAAVALAGSAGLATAGGALKQAAAALAGTAQLAATNLPNTGAAPLQGAAGLAATATAIVNAQCALGGAAQLAVVNTDPPWRAGPLMVAIIDDAA